MIIKYNNALCCAVFARSSSTTMRFFAQSSVNGDDKAMSFCMIIMRQSQRAVRKFPLRSSFFPLDPAYLREWCTDTLWRVFFRLVPKDCLKLQLSKGDRFSIVERAAAEKS